MVIFLPNHNLPYVASFQLSCGHCEKRLLLPLYIESENPLRIHCTRNIHCIRMLGDLYICKRVRKISYYQGFHKLRTEWRRPARPRRMWWSRYHPRRRPWPTLAAAWWTWTRWSTTLVHVISDGPILLPVTDKACGHRPMVTDDISHL